MSLILIFAHKAHKYYSCYFDSSMQACQLILPLTLFHPKKSCNPLSRNSLIPTLLCQSFSEMKDVIRVVGIVAGKRRTLELSWSFIQNLKSVKIPFHHRGCYWVRVPFIWLHACQLPHTRAKNPINALFLEYFLKKKKKQTNKMKKPFRFDATNILCIEELSISASRRDFRRWHDIFRR